MRDLPYFLSLRYPVELIDDDGVFVASHPDLPGCISQGDSPDEAVANLNDAREAWLRVSVEDGLPIAEPVKEESYSGRVSLRIPSYLHADLARISQRSSISLNQLMNNVLSEFVGGRRVHEVVRSAREEIK